MALAGALMLLAFTSPVHSSTRAVAAFWGAAAVLAVWSLAVLFTRPPVRLEIQLRRQHYLQACAQSAVFLYWGWYWPPVVSHLPYLAAQLLFAYGFDMLLGWWRRGTYVVGFGLFPIVFSINLFLWFRPDWFWLQFAMVAGGLLAKEFLRWQRDGRSAHIFNPSSFPLAIASLGLLAAGASGITVGQEIAATQFYPPQMYLFLFLIGLPGQFFFGVTSMTMSAVAAIYLFGRIYFAITGIYFFYDSYIPIAVFLGMHLLFTDPSTSPRSEGGRMFFGALYGLSTMALYQVLGMFGLPTFYDKLLQVPLMNLSVRAIDRAAGSLNVLVLPTLTGLRRNVAYMAVWGVLFAMFSVGGLNDNHPGQWLPFWRQACQEGRAYACPYLADLDFTHCRRGSGWACNEAGLMHIALARSGEDLRRAEPQGAAEPFRFGCQLGFAMACRNLNELRLGSGAFAAAAPTLADLPIILRGSKGEIEARSPEELYAIACRQGWPGTCR